MKNTSAVSSTIWVKSIVYPCTFTSSAWYFGSALVVRIHSSFSILHRRLPWVLPGSPGHFGMEGNFQRWHTRFRTMSYELRRKLCRRRGSWKESEFKHANIFHTIIQSYSNSSAIPPLPPMRVPWRAERHHEQFTRWMNPWRDWFNDWTFVRSLLNTPYLSTVNEWMNGWWLLVPPVLISLVVVVVV